MERRQIGEDVRSKKTTQLCTGTYTIRNTRLLVEVVVFARAPILYYHRGGALRGTTSQISNDGAAVALGPSTAFENPASSRDAVCEGITHASAAAFSKLQRPEFQLKPHD